MTIRMIERREVDATEDLMVSVARDHGRRSVLPGISFKAELIELQCLWCGNRWRG